MAFENLPLPIKIPLLILLLFICRYVFIPGTYRPVKIKRETDWPKDKNVIIGIDLGTSYSCVGVYINGRVEIIPNDQGNRISPSYVAFTADGERLIGDSAKSQLASNPENTVFNSKRLIGRQWEDKPVQEDKKYLPFLLMEKEDKSLIELTVDGEKKTYAAQEISAMILTKMKEMAESYLGKTVNHAVIAVPAYFNDLQRQATKDAATIAGLEVVRLINEPTAAAIAYGMDKGEDEDKMILVFDLGGGKCDVSLVNFGNGVFQVMATNGDTHLGGEDFDQRLIAYFIKLYKESHGKDIRKYPSSLQKLRREVERTKRMLSSKLRVTIKIENFLDGKTFYETITRSKFEELNMDLFEASVKLIETVLYDAYVFKKEIDEVILIGGSTRIPKIQNLITKFFKGKELYVGINPDEAVAYGAAVQAAVLGGIDLEIAIIDVNPITLGYEVKGGIMSNLIKKYTAIPTSKSEEVTTPEDGQTNVLVQVFQGERPLTKDNQLLGSFESAEFPPARSGVPKIKITFDLDINGILNVSAVDKATGLATGIVIKEAKNRLTSIQIERMVKKAAIFTKKDKKIKRRIESRTKLEDYAYSLKKKLRMLGTYCGEVTEEEIETIETAAIKVIEWLEQNENADGYDFRVQKQALEELAQPILSKCHEENGGETDNGRKPIDDEL